MPSQLPLHPACLLFPPLPPAEFDALVADIAAHGLAHPIVMHEGQVLDGRNRLMACQQAGVPPRFTQWQGEGSPLQWAISANIRRRHLSPSQRAILALDLLPRLERDAKARQRLSRGRGRKAPTTAAVGAVRGKASQIAARLAATNSSYVERAKRLRAECPDIIEAVRSGGVTLAEATPLSRFPPDVRARAVHVRLVEPNRTIIDAIRTALAASPPARPASKRRRGSVRIWCGDCLSLLRTSVEDASVDVVCTSPPYNVGVRYGTYDDQRPPTAFSDWLDEVFRELRRVLKPTGSLFLVAGHAARHPWAAFDIAWGKSIAVDGRTRGHYRPIASGRRLNRTWEHLLHFSIDGRAALDKAAIGVPYGDDRGQARHGNASGTHCLGDAWFIPHATVQSAVQRGGHPATFPVTLAERCLRLVGCGRGALVLDPFCVVNGIAAAVPEASALTLTNPTAGMRQSRAGRRSNTGLAGHADCGAKPSQGVGGVFPGRDSGSTSLSMNYSASISIWTMANSGRN